MKKFARIGVAALCCMLAIGSMVACKKDKDTKTTTHIKATDGIVFGTHTGGAAYEKLAATAVKAGTGEREHFIVVTVPHEVTMVDMDVRPYFDGKNILGADFYYTRAIDTADGTRGYAYEPVVVGEDVTANTWRKYGITDAQLVAQGAMTGHALYAGVLDENAPAGTVARWSAYIGQSNFNKEIVYHFFAHDGNEYVLKLFVEQAAAPAPASAAVVAPATAPAKEVVKEAAKKETVEAAKKTSTKKK